MELFFVNDKKKTPTFDFFSLMDILEKEKENDSDLSSTLDLIYLFFICKVKQVFTKSRFLIFQRRFSSRVTDMIR